MGNAAIVFLFPEPEDGITLGYMIKAAKEAFVKIAYDDDVVDVGEVTIKLANDKTADEIHAIFSPEGDSGESNLVSHARYELALLGNDTDFDNSLIRAIRAFASYGHSGGSHMAAVPILHDLLQFKNLSPLTNDPEEWMNVAEESGIPIWQSKRNPKAFSNDGGKTYYLLSDRDTTEKGVELPTYIASDKPSKNEEKVDTNETN